VSWPLHDHVDLSSSQFQYFLDYSSWTFWSNYVDSLVKLSGQFDSTFGHCKLQARLLAVGMVCEMLMVLDGHVIALV
jgi:hypothetical protein